MMKERRMNNNEGISITVYDEQWDVIHYDRYVFNWFTVCHGAKFYL